MAVWTRLARPTVRSANASGHKMSQTSSERPESLSAAQRKKLWSDDTGKLAAAQLKHGKYTKTELAKAKRRAETGRRILAELKRIEGQIMELGLMPDD